MNMNTLKEFYPHYNTIMRIISEREYDVFTPEEFMGFIGMVIDNYCASHDGTNSKDMVEMISILVKQVYDDLGPIKLD